MSDRDDQKRIAHLVFLSIQRHPLLEPLRDAGVIVYVSHHAEAIWASALPSAEHPGRYGIETWIRHPGWWVPVLDTSEDWAGKLATRLAKGIRKEWEERS